MGNPVRPDPLPPTGVPAPDGKPFYWGPIDQVHAVGVYQIVQYREDKSNHSDTQPEQWLHHGRIRFHPYVDGVDTHQVYGNLGSALVGAVGYLREGPNGRAAEYFDRMTLPGAR